MRFFLVLTFTLLTTSLLAQRVTLFNSNGSSGITSMCPDDDDNRYIFAYYKGYPTFYPQLPTVMDKNQYYMAKLSTENQVLWAKTIDHDKSRWEMIIKDNMIITVAWYMKNDRTANKYERGLYLEKYDLNGSLISRKELAFVNNDDVDLHSYVRDNGIVIRATFKGDKNSFQIRGKTFTKKKYSTVIFWKLNFDGEQEWEYQIEGGFNGFTDLRINDVDIDQEGNTYIGSYYSESAELGITSLTTKKAFDGPIDLYEYGTFLMKIDKNGTAVKAKSIADYQFELEKILVNNDQQVYISAYYKGSNAYEKANPSDGNYKAAYLLGQPLPDTRSEGNGVTAPSEDHVYALLDKDFNLIWRQFSRFIPCTIHGAG